jgi:hypothetical protein
MWVTWRQKLWFRCTFFISFILHYGYLRRKENNEIRWIWKSIWRSLAWKSTKMQITGTQIFPFGRSTFLICASPKGYVQRKDAHEIPWPSRSIWRSSASKVQKYSCLEHETTNSHELFCIVFILTTGVNGHKVLPSTTNGTIYGRRFQHTARGPESGPPGVSIWPTKPRLILSKFNRQVPVVRQLSGLQLIPQTLLINTSWNSLTFKMTVTWRPLSLSMTCWTFTAAMCQQTAIPICRRMPRSSLLCSEAPTVVNNCFPDWKTRNRSRDLYLQTNIWQHHCDFHC